MERMKLDEKWPLSSNLYVIARTAKQRPSLMHLTSPLNRSQTMCGVVMVGWSRAYFREPIPQVMCKRCVKRSELTNR